VSADLGDDALARALEDIAIGLWATLPRPTKPGHVDLLAIRDAQVRNCAACGHRVLGDRPCGMCAFFVTETVREAS
jgi:hypothetical protein